MSEELFDVSEPARPSERARAHLDAQGIKAGMLMEAAEAHQQIVAAALQRLEATTRSLEPSVRQAAGEAASDAVGQAAKAEFALLRSEAQRTVQALQGIRGGVSWNLGLLASAIAAVTVVFSVASIYVFSAVRTAPAAGLAGLQADPAILAEIERRGLKIEVSLCGEARMPCAKANTKAGGYGPRRDLLLLPTQSAP